MKPNVIELVDELQPSIPKRSRLYRLAPQNIFSGFVESLTGYIARLAEAHCLPVWVLVTREIAPLFNRKSIIDVPNGHCDLLGKFGGAVNGNNGTAEEAVTAVELLTTQGALANLTMLLARNYISTTPLLRRTQAWCQECLRDWLDAGQEIYYPLLWSLSAVRICPTHQKPLLDACNQCHRSHYPLARRLRIGHCMWCGSWLGCKTVDFKHAQISVKVSDIFAAGGKVMAKSTMISIDSEEWGGRRDLNPRQPDPQSGALTRLSYDHQLAGHKLIFAAARVKFAFFTWQEPG